MSKEKLLIFFLLGMVASQHRTRRKLLAELEERRQQRQAFLVYLNGLHRERGLVLDPFDQIVFDNMGVQVRKRQVKELKDVGE